MQENWAQAPDVSMISYTWRILVRSFVRSTCKPGRRAGLSPAVTEIPRRWGVWKGLIKPTQLPPVEGILLYLRKKRKKMEKEQKKEERKINTSKNRWTATPPWFCCFTFDSLIMLLLTISLTEEGWNSRQLCKDQSPVFTAALLQLHLIP